MNAFPLSRASALLLPLLLPLLLAPAAIAQSDAVPTPPPAAQAPSAAQLPDAPSTTTHMAPAATPTGPTVLLETSMGRLTCQLFDQQAPLTTANFVGLATGTKPYTDPATRQQVTGKPFYNGTQFHRVIPGFMIQGGDPLATGTGDAGYYLPDEISPSLRFDVAGRLAMANSGPNTSSSQFFITELPNAELNGHYTIFGQCDAHSVLLVASIARVERDAQDKPYTPVTLNKVTVIPAGQPAPPDPAPAAPAAATPSPSPTPRAPQP